MFVAVVSNQNPKDTGRPDGSLSCFLSDTKEGAINKSIQASEQWERLYHSHDHDYASTGTLRGPYRILVGEISEEADRAPKYELVKFGGA